MTNFKIWDIVLVPFPFTDLSTHKKRPALVLTKIISTSLPTLLVIAMITSRIEAEILLGDCPLEDWEQEGLLNPSKVRLAKVVSLEEKMVLKKLGSLSKRDKEIIQREFKRVFESILS